MHEEVRRDRTFQNQDNTITWMPIISKYGAAVFLEYL